MTLSHLDDDALSAALDGEATAQEQSHLATCAACQDRIETLRAVAHVVGAPVRPRPAAAVDSAIHEALDAAWVIEAGATGGEAGIEDDRVLTGRPGAGAGRAAAARAGAGRAGAGRAGGRGPGTRRYRFGRAGGQSSRPSRPLVAAAVIVAVLGTVGGLLGVLARGSGPTASKTSAGVSRSQSALPPSPAAPSGQADSQLKGVSPGAAPNAAAKASPSPSGGTVQQGLDLGPQSDPAVVGRMVDAQLNAGGEASHPAVSSANGGPEPAVALPCAVQGATAAGLAGQEGALIYIAPVRWRGDDAEVLVYRRSTGARVGVVMRRADCSQLAALSL